MEKTGVAYPMKKVLVISYYFPPAGGPGSLRVVKFVRYLSRMGWQPVVLTVKKGEFPYRDESLAKEIPPNVVIHRTTSWDPFLLYKKFTGKSEDETIPIGILTHKKTSLKEKIAAFVRSNFFIPDARIGWIPFALWKAFRIIRQEKIKLVFISSPPHSSQLVGFCLKTCTGIPWVADLRDPWTDIRYYEFVKRSKISYRLDRFLETLVLKRTNAITTVSSDLVRMFSAKLKGNFSGKFHIIPNGYDEEDFSALEYQPHSTFEILHTGNMQDHQNPLILWKVLRKMTDQHSEYRHLIRVRLVGRTHPEIQQAVTEMGLEDMVSFLPFKPHREILPMMKNADLLLMVIPRVQKNLGIVTGKFFEYMGTNCPILIIGPPESDAGKLIRPLVGSLIINYDDEGKLEQYLIDAITKWKAGKWFFDNREYTRQFSRKVLTEKLITIFNQQT